MVSVEGHKVKFDALTILFETLGAKGGATADLMGVKLDNSTLVVEMVEL